MSNPQAEDGHTDIANEILEALWKVNLSAYETRILLYLIRKTYGWHKKLDSISLSQFSKDIGIDRRLVHRTLKELSSKGMIVVIPQDDRKPANYGFQKDYEKWKLSSPKMTHRKLSSPEMMKLSSPEIPTKETIQKKRDKKIKSSILPDNKFWEEVRNIYYWIDVDIQIQKMKGYKLTPKGRKWNMTQRSVIAWLNRIDKPMEDQNGKDQPPTDIIDRRLWEIEQDEKRRKNRTKAPKKDPDPS